MINPQLVRVGRGQPNQGLAPLVGALIWFIVFSFCLVALSSNLGLASEGWKPENIAHCAKKTYVLDYFEAHETYLTEWHMLDVNDVADKIIGSFGFCKMPYDFVELKGHAAPWKDLTPSILYERSLLRAKSTRDEIRRRLTGGYNEHVFMWMEGYAGDLPVADNFTRLGRTQNRRVEIRLCRTYETMKNHIKAIKKEDFDVYGNDLKRHEIQCLTKQLKNWTKNPSKMGPSVKRVAKELHKNLYGPGSKGCDPDKVRKKIARLRREEKKSQFRDIEAQYEDMRIGGAGFHEVLPEDNHRLAYKSEACKKLRKYRKRAKDSGNILYCFGKRIHDPGRFDLCLRKPKPKA